MNEMSGMSDPETVASRQTHEGRLVKVRVDTLRMEDGREFDLEVVEHARSIVVMPVTGNDSVLLVRQWRQPTGGWLLEAPAGRMDDDDDSPADAAQRELREETGFLAGELTPLGAFWTAPGLFTEYMYAYIARNLRSAPLPPDPGEEVTVEEIPLDRLPGLIESGEICDAKTILSAFWLLRNLDMKHR